jgi:hypothetical protein
MATTSRSILLRDPRTRLAAMLMVALLAAGCGGGDSDSDSESGSANRADTDTARRAEGATSTPSGRADQGSNSPDGPGTTPSDSPETGTQSRKARRRAAATCKENVERIPQLPASDEAALKKECERSLRGEPGGRDSSRAVCAALVRRAVPKGLAREQAMAACKRS